ncbi:MAG TPA: hypothetical protein VHN14_17010 [Kofleriaceae bacterium]|jgi:hypothetical protein|nr:hypothetical protein [Kofleriaceae bacterium]
MIRIALDTPWPEVVVALREDRTFRAGFAERLRAIPYEAWFWECNRVSSALFECVIIDAPALARSPADPSAFAEHLSAPINTFESLRGDATLIAPSATGSYPHLAAFLRFAPASQVDALFQAVGEAIAHWPRHGTPWVSTAGMGVSWLHVRLDSRPKYFRHAPYRSA